MDQAKVFEIQERLRQTAMEARAHTNLAVEFARQLHEQGLYPKERLVLLEEANHRIHQALQ